jgi:hypothetical protein
MTKTASILKKPRAENPFRLIPRKQPNENGNSSTPIQGGTTSMVSDKYYRYVQSHASDVWVVKHNLNKYPSVTVSDSSGTIYDGDVRYLDLNSLMITFSVSLSGYADIN